MTKRKRRRFTYPMYTYAPETITTWESVCYYQFAGGYDCVNLTEDTHWVCDLIPGKPVLEEYRIPNTLILLLVGQLHPLDMSKDLTDD